jgi:hypothetical protein
LLTSQGADFVVALKQAQARAFAEHAVSLAAAAGWRPLALPAEEAPLGHVLLQRGWA